MFSNLLPQSYIPFNAIYTEYALSHFQKDFSKKYKGKQWEKTEASFFEDLKRLRMPNNTTQSSSQIDELKHKNDYWLFKYDFRIAGTNESTKSSGNRIVGFVDNKSNKMLILLIYMKTHLPKNQGETVFIFDTIKREHSDIYKLFE